MALHLPRRVQQFVDPKTGHLDRVWERFFGDIAESYGTWTSVTFNAAHFTGNGSMTWTVAEGDVTTFAYTRMGKRLEVAFTIRTATVGGTPNTTLQMAIPGVDANGAALVAARTVTVPALTVDNGTRAIGVASVTAGASVIGVQLVGGGNWAAATNTTGVEGVIAFEVQG